MYQTQTQRILYSSYSLKTHLSLSSF